MTEEVCNPKACKLQTTAKTEYAHLFREVGLRYRDFRIVQYDPRSDTWVPYPKHQLLLEWYVKFGCDYKPSEIERELFPAVVAWFYNSADARVF